MAGAQTKGQRDRLKSRGEQTDEELISSRGATRASSSSRPDELTTSEHSIQSRVIEQISPARLKPHPSNAKTHPKKQIRQIARSVERFGFQSPVIVNADNVILAGHGRVEAARLLALAHIPCLRVTGLSDAEERAFVIADNKIAANGGWDRGILAESLQTLMIELPQLEIPEDLSITGIESGDIDAILSDHEVSAADPADDVAVAPADSPIITRSGDLWLLGVHRLVCGDARDPGAFEKLMGGKCADVVIIDPPWNVIVNGHVSGRGTRQHAEFAFASGEMSDRQYRRFLASSYKRLLAACKDGALVYVFIDWRHIEVVCEVGRTLGLLLRNVCVWSKTTPGQGSFYRSAHELVAVFQKPGATAVNNIELGKFGRSRTNVWTFASPNKFKDTDDPLSGHPTPKPVAMIAEAVKDASHRRDIVLDSFLGSGTTILAAEKVGRLGYGIEYEPVYCDLAIRRWQAFTGKDAVLSATGQTFDEITAATRPPGPPTSPDAPLSV